MNPGSEPERDDFGLPPVDIEIPDDARELDRDVQAYHREQRALRRRLRRRRLRGPLASDGMIMPLLAGCLVFALIAAVLLTVFAATGGIETRRPAPPPAQAGRTPDTIGPAAGPAIIRLSGPLPDKSILVRGRSVRLRTLSASALALVPLRCSCTTVLRQLISQATRTGVTLYLVGASPAVTGLGAIAARNSAVQVADDRQNVLATTYKPSGLSLLLVGANGSLALAQKLRPGLQLESELAGLKQHTAPTAPPTA